MSEILTLEEYDAALNVGYTAGYHDGAFPQEPSYSEQFEKVRGAMLAHDAAQRAALKKAEQRADMEGAVSIRFAEARDAEKARADKAEARVARLETALREIIALPYRKFIGFAKRIAIAALKETR